MKIFRITKRHNNPLYYCYKIEQRMTILLFIHWWATPIFAPPHLFYTKKEAEKRILEEYPDAAICYRTKIEWEEDQ